MVFLSLGLPAASVLAWLVMTADGARREQIAQKYLELNATKKWKYNSKRQPDVLDDQRDHWIDKLLSDQMLSAKTSLRSSANAFVEPVTLGPEAIEAALRQFALRRRVASGHIGSGGPLPGGKGKYEWPKLVPGKTARTKESYGLDDGRLKGRSPDWCQGRFPELLVNKVVPRKRFIGRTAAIPGPATPSHRPYFG